MKCSCHCNGKCHLLGGLEQKIMDTLWQSSHPLKPKQVLTSLPDRYAYTTVMTVLKRMVDKKILTRQLKGKAYYYLPVKDKNSFGTAGLDDLFHRLFHTYGRLAVDCFLTAAKKSGYQI